MARRFLFGTLIFLVLSACKAQNATPPSKTVNLIAGGDVVWTQRVRLPEYYFGVQDKTEILRKDGWRRLPFVATPQAKTYLEDKYQRPFETDKAHFKTAIQFDISFKNDQLRLAYPFTKIGQTLQSADIAFVNLETPLSNDGRLSGAFRMDERFAKDMADNGIDVVSTANNHAFDAEGEGISDTLHALKEAGIVAVGTGQNLDDAIQAKIVTIKGQKFAFLAFTYGVNPTVTSLGFATEERSGAAPLDPFLIKKAIKNVRDDADFVIVSLHWGLENKTDVHPAAQEFAHEIIDSGADVILGHHPHVPRGVEVYKHGLIAYSLGNFIFGHNHDNWEDNFLLDIKFNNKTLTEADIIPIAGTGIDITQPFVLEGERAQASLKSLSARSKTLGTDIRIEGDKGIIMFPERD